MVHRGSIGHNMVHRMYLTAEKESAQPMNKTKEEDISVV